MTKLTIKTYLQLISRKKKIWEKRGLLSPSTTLSSAEASPLCVVGEAGEKEKESARGIFSIILFWWGYPAGASAEERASAMSTTHHYHLRVRSTNEIRPMELEI